MSSKGNPCFGEFNCRHCKIQWKSSKSFENTGQKCRNCKNMIMATNQRPLKQAKRVYKAKDEAHLKGEGPFFGEFNCQKCHKNWLSALCWLEEDGTKVPQKCKRCKVNAFAMKMRPLEKTELQVTKPHQGQLCGKCKKLGYSCETFKLKRMTNRFSSWKI